MFLTAYYALRNHFLQRPGEQLTFQQAHDLWNAWPDQDQPLYLTEKALESLERDGVVERMTNKWQLACCFAVSEFHG